MSEMIDAATEFRKNSFNDEDAAELALIATMYQNVADEAVSAGDSASFIISQKVILCYLIILNILLLKILLNYV